jgi:tyrosyl-tRNA synthetase
MFSFNKNTKVITDEKAIEDILSRSVSAIYPEKELLKKELMSGRRLRIYVGADATGKNLHLGHATNFILIEKFRKLGHEIIILFGDFTAQIGDPTDKGAERVRLTKTQVEQNLKTWKSQISKVVNFNESNKPKIVRNSEWLSKLSFEDVINLSANFTLQQIIERDMFQERIKNQKPIYLHEFFYPLMQGYDSVFLNVDLEIGGTDQTFNMLAGRTLLEKLKNKNKFVLSTLLLENPKTGKKLMSKSEGGYVGLNDSPMDMFGKIMTLPDEVILPLFIHGTFVSMDDISKIEQDLLSGKNPKEIKMLLAKEIVTIYHSEKEAKNASENFEKTFSQKEVQDFQEFTIQEKIMLSEFLILNKIVESKSEVQRLVSSGAIQNLDNKEKIKDSKIEITENISLKIGKRKFIKIIFKN